MALSQSDIVSVVTPGDRPRVLIVCTYFRRDRTKSPDRDFLQPLAGVHIGSCIDHAAYAVTLHHEEWQGPYDPRGEGACAYALVFLSGLQQDFDRMRQLSCWFRRAGAIVVAGGSICTLFPEFAAQFFDAVCVGGVEAVFDVMQDHEAGRLRPIYRARARPVGRFPVAYHLLAEAGIDPPVHLLEASRGCSFRCSFCVLPAEGSSHAPYGAAALEDMIGRAIAASPRISLRRLFPMVWLMDNNLSDDRAYLEEVCAVLARPGRMRAWGALITQNVLADRKLIARMARARCRALFVGIESFDREFLVAMRKRQNLGRAGSVIDDVQFAERQGIAIVYSHLIDPRSARIDGTIADLRAIAVAGRLPLPAFISFVSPLAGTELFWSNVAGGELRPGLRLREMDGETIAFRQTAEPVEALAAFARTLFADTRSLVPRRMVVWNVARRMLRAHRADPLGWLVAVVCAWRMLAKSSDYARAGRNYLGGQDRLDPQYDEQPPGIDEADRQRYFEPVRLIEPDGSLSPWLERYRPRASARPPADAHLETLEAGP